MKATLTALLFVLAAPHFCLAGSGAGAINMTFNTSARFEAMGSAGVGAPWGTDTNHWANPALLAYRPGIHYLGFEAELAKGLADDIELTNQELTFGAYGATLLLATGPIKGNYLDMGTQSGTDENGMDTGSFDSYMESKSWGIGVDLVSMLDLILKKEDGGLGRYLSVAVGFNKHEFKDHLATDQILQDQGGGEGSGESTDRGYVIRGTTPVLDMGYVGLMAGFARGSSLLSDADEFIDHIGADQSDPFPRAYLEGWSFHAALVGGQALDDWATTDAKRVLVNAIDPLLSYTYTEQTNVPGYVWTGTDYVYGRDTSGQQEESGGGREIGILNTIYFRSGYVEAVYGNINGRTSGWGINLQAGLMGGFRYDYATVPQATGLPEVNRESWSFWIDPMEIFDW